MRRNTHDLLFQFSFKYFSGAINEVKIAIVPENNTVVLGGLGTLVFYSCYTEIPATIYSFVVCIFHSTHFEYTFAEIQTPTTAPSALNSTSFTSAMPRPVKYWSTSQDTDKAKPTATIFLASRFHSQLVTPYGT